MELAVDFIIIGAGAAGVSVAHELTDHGSVLVLEKEPETGHHATGRSAAVFVDSYGDSVVQALSAASRPLFDTALSDVEESLLNPRGLLHIVRAGSPALPMNDSRGLLPRLSTNEARARIPILREQAIDGAYWEETAADIDVHSLMAGLTRSILRRGGRILKSAPFLEARRGAGVWTLTVGGATLTAPFLVNAAGAWAAEVGQTLGASGFGLTPLRRTAATFALPAQIDASRWPMAVDLDVSVYFKPDAGRLLLSPADETPVVAQDAYAEDFDVAVAVDRFEALTDCPLERLVVRWAGLRTSAADSRPIIGFDPTVEGLFWLAGQGGFGIQTALAAARLSRYLLTRDRTLPEVYERLAPLVSPARFGR